MRFIFVFFVFLVVSFFYSAGSLAGTAEDNAIFLSSNRHDRYHQWEISPYGGSYLGRHLGQTWTVGGRCHYHFNNSWSMGVHYGYVRTAADPVSSFGTLLVDKNVHIVNAEARFINDAAVRFGQRIVEMDFYATLGVGSMRINANWEPAGVIGGGVRFYTPLTWLALDIDANNYAHFTAVTGGEKFDFDTLFTAGVSFFFH